MATIVNVLQPVTRVWVELGCGHHSEVSFEGSGASEYRIRREVRCEQCSLIGAAALGRRLLSHGDIVNPIDINEPPSAIS